jgi:hypothetical protein
VRALAIVLGLACLGLHSHGTEATLRITGYVVPWSSLEIEVADEGPARVVEAVYCEQAYTCERVSGVAIGEVRVAVEPLRIESGGLVVAAAH